MPRRARSFSEGEYSHVMVRGINKENIFYDDEDRQRYLETMRRFSAETEVFILAWCLMSNHVHLLLRAERLPDVFMKKLGCSYVPYFNRKYGRVGHLFQDRYRSEAITDEGYLFAVLRYIHMNPEKAHICKMCDYRWSSYGEYLKPDKPAGMELILEMLGGPEGYIQFMDTADTGSYMDDDYRFTDKEALELFFDLYPEGAVSVQSLPRGERNSAIVKLCDAGLSAAQICRVTGLGKSVVYGVLK